jgi:hypothetical protein
MCLPVSWRREATLPARFLPMSGSSCRLLKQTKLWRSKVTVTSSYCGHLKKLKRATRSWRPSAAGEKDGIRNDHAQEVHSMLSLPDYTRWLHEKRRK